MPAYLNSTNFVLTMDRLSTLPEECLSEILRRTSPEDASRAAVVSKGLRSAADSDTVWDKFLPSDLLEIVSKSVSPVVYATKKELYFSLCRSPILIDAGKLVTLLHLQIKYINFHVWSSINALIYYMFCFWIMRIYCF